MKIIKKIVSSQTLFNTRKHPYRNSDLGYGMFDILAIMMWGR